MGNGSMIVCKDVLCDEMIKNDRWSKTRAHTAGWYFSKDGHAYCPQHTPDWVKSWRKKKEK